MISRRGLLVTGGAAVVVGGGGIAAMMARSDLSEARRPWEAAGAGFGDPRLDALSYAILAPNPHNMQPWRVRLDGDDALTLFVDTGALLPATDPFNRQIVVGLGAFLELLRQAAAEAGYRSLVTAFPEGEPRPVLDGRPVAVVRLVRGDTARDPLFGAALARRTSRLPFGERVPPETALAALHSPRGGTGFGVTAAPARVGRLKALCRAGWEAEVAATAPHAESTRLTRIGAREINAAPDGISLGGPVMEAMALAGVLSRAAMAEPGSTAHAETLKFYNGLIDSAAAFGWLTTPANTRADQLRAGADWVRINLAATRAGIAMHPLSQVLQEFPEMAGLYRETHAYLGVAPPGVVQGLFRFGYADAPPPSPRWPVQSRLVGL